MLCIVFEVASIPKTVCGRSKGILHGPRSVCKRALCVLVAPAGAVRLVAGLHQCEGRVEMFSGSEWGTVCDDAWDIADAQVVCNQLGCGEAMAARPEAFFGPGGGTILLDNLKCRGDEASLQGCSHIAWDVHNCDHSEDAGVTCSMS